jgi:hypothetical protein
MGSLALPHQSKLKELVAKLSAEARAARADCFRLPLVLTAMFPQVERSPCSTSFPMGREAAHILRFVSEETVLLNSREKAPFLLLVEVRHTQLPGGVDAMIRKLTYSYSRVLAEDQLRLSNAVTPALAPSLPPRPEVSC